MDSFNEIYILDLHGNSLKKEKCPDGSKDENVFDIQQGVVIALFIKKKDRKKENNVHYSEGWGLREKKYEWLDKNDLKTTRWQQLSPKSEFYLFVPRDEILLERYEKFPKINDIFPTNSVGIVTARDNLSIKWTPAETWSTVLNFSKLDIEIARQAYDLGKDARDWKVELAQKDLKDSGLDKKKIVPILYRPYDIRYTYYTGRSRGFHCMPRPEVMSHMLQENLGLITPKQFKEEPGAFVTSNIIGHKTVSAYDINYLFPLFLYLESTKKHLFNYEKADKQRQPNINPEVFITLTEAYKKKPTPEDIFFYIYAVLYSKTYRTKYTEFLKIDFPRVPFTKAYTLFSKMAEYGKQLVDLHLLKSPDLDSPVAKFQGQGNEKFEKIRYENGRVYINNDQYFEGVKPEVWQYQIGGYQVCEKWLKDRKGRSLSLDDMKHYCRMVTALSKTIELQKVIDEMYPEVEKGTIT
jgi:predicted helicase